MSLIKKDFFFWITAFLLVLVVFFMLSWMTLALFMSGTELNYHTWYLLPVVPLSAAFIAFALYQKGNALKKTILNIFIGLNIIVLTISTFYVLFVNRQPVVGSGICLGLLTLSAYYNDILKNVSTEVYIANAIALLYFNVVVLMRFF